MQKFEFSGDVLVALNEAREGECIEWCAKTVQPSCVANGLPCQPAHSRTGGALKKFGSALSAGLQRRSVMQNELRQVQSRRHSHTSYPRTPFPVVLLV
jgi:hypothetical protein